MRVDLHMHTTASDGNFTPSQLVAAVKKAGIDLFAVTDHDSTASVLEAEKLAHAAGMRFIRGLEVSSNQGSIIGHILGYRIDIEHAGLQRHIASNRGLFEASQLASLRLIQGLGVNIDLDDFEEYTYDRTRGGWKALNFLIDRGVVSGADEFFQRFVKGNTAKFFPMCPPTTLAIQMVRDAGGIPILAHPGESLKKLDQAQREETIRGLCDAGLRGVECFSPYHSADEIVFWRDLASRFGLLATAGSDNHGPFTPARALGHPKAFLADLNLGDIFESR